MGQREWWHAHNLWQHDVVSEYCKLEETPLYVTLFFLCIFEMQYTDKKSGCRSRCWYVSLTVVLDSSNSLSSCRTQPHRAVFDG